MRVTIRCKGVNVLRSDENEIAVVLDGVNEDDLACAYTLCNMAQEIDLFKDVGLEIAKTNEGRVDLGVLKIKKDAMEE